MLIKGQRKLLLCSVSSLDLAVPAAIPFGVLKVLKDLIVVADDLVHATSQVLVTHTAHLLDLIDHTLLHYLGGVIDLSVSLSEKDIGVFGL